jgi:hypothetical protein
LRGAERVGGRSDLLFENWLLMILRLLQGVAWPTRGARSWWVLIAGLLVIFAWQRSIRRAARHNDDSYKVIASTGLNLDANFFFYLRHMGLGPMTAVPAPQCDSRQEAERILRAAPQSIVMDQGSTFRSGDRGRLFLFYVDLWHRGERCDSRAPRVQPANVAAFTLALWLVWAGFWWIRRPLLGAIVLALIGSNPLQLYAAYHQANVFSWPITGMLLLLGLNLPLFDPVSRKSKAPIVIAVASGVAITFIRSVRAEASAIAGALLIVYALMPGAKLWMRAATIAGLFVAMSLSSEQYTKYFDREHERASLLLATRGGTPYHGPIEPYHEFWHPMWCGLGDFDTKYGYKWDDLEAYRYAVSQTNKRPDFQREINPNEWMQSIAHDQAGHHPLFTSESPGYHAALREKVLRDIGRDPKWYADILWKRFKRVMEQTTPVSFAAGELTLRFSSGLWGYFALLCGVFFALRRDLFALKLLLFSAPLSATALMVYSGGGTPLYTTAHLFAVALFAHEVLRAAAEFVCSMPSARERAQG